MMTNTTRKFEDAHRRALETAVHLADPVTPLELGDEREPIIKRAHEGLDILGDYNTRVVDRRDVAQVADLLDAFTNAGFHEEFAALAELIGKWHPTLQQQFGELVLQFIKVMAAKEYVDGRNEYITMLCRQLTAVVDTYTNGTHSTPRI